MMAQLETIIKAKANMMINIIAGVESLIIFFTQTLS
jgi:hypothetical protein